MSRVLLIILCIAVVVVIDYLIRRVRQGPHWTKSPTNGNGRSYPPKILSADEADPTETGRFRAQQVLTPSCEESRRAQIVDLGLENTDVENVSPLPDPFAEDPKAKE